MAEYKAECLARWRAEHLGKAAQWVRASRSPKERTARLAKIRNVYGREFFETLQARLGGRDAGLDARTGTLF